MGISGIFIIVWGVVIFLIAGVVGYSASKRTNARQEPTHRGVGERQKYRDPVITCDYCGARIDTAKETTCPLCGGHCGDLFQLFQRLGAGKGFFHRLSPSERQLISLQRYEYRTPRPAGRGVEVLYRKV